MEYVYKIDPPMRCSNCSNNLVEILKSDKELIEFTINNNKYKKNVLKGFLVSSRNKTLLTKILDPEIVRAIK